MVVRTLALAGALIALPATLAAQDAATPAPEKEVEGATAERQALISQCSAHKFESVVVLDPVKNRTTRVKLCSVPGASDVEWVKTLRAAITQIEQRRMPGAAKAQLIDELKAEIARFDPKAVPTIALTAPKPTITAPVATPPMERFETSTLPSLQPRATPVPAPTERFEVAKLPPLTAPKGSAAATPPKSMAIAVKCLTRGESGAGGTCDFLEKDTVLAVRAVNGLEKGGKLRFLRRGDERGEVQLAAMEPGGIAKVALPSSLCRGVSSSKVELVLLAPNSSAVSARMGPYGLRC